MQIMRFILISWIFFFKKWKELYFKLNIIKYFYYKIKRNLKIKKKKKNKKKKKKKNIKTIYRTSKLIRNILLNIKIKLYVFTNCIIIHPLQIMKL